MIKEELLIDDRISPTTLLEEIFPESGRKKIWRQLEARSAQQFPELVLPDLRNHMFNLFRNSFSLFRIFRNSFAVADMRELTNKIVELNYGIFKPAGIPRTEVEMIINNIISDRAGLDLSDISPEKSFVDDLGIN